MKYINGYLIQVMIINSADESKKLVTVWLKHLSEPERSSLVLSENGMVHMVSLEVTVREVPMVEISNKQLRHQKNTETLYF